MQEAATTPRTDRKGRKARPEALDRLTAGVQEVASRDEWQRLLRFRRAFHNYSFNNLLLILMQKPNATHVAGYRKWQELGRQVQKGEKSIRILAPLIRKEQDERTGEERRRVYGFREVSVFDISQTKGEPVPTTPHVPALHGDDAGTLAALTAAAEGLGATVSYAKLQGAYGQCNIVTGEITLQEGLEPLQAAQTLAHEVAHHVLHGRGSDEGAIPEDRDVAELEAESAAFLILDAYGLDTASHAFGYLTRFGGDDADAMLTAGRRAFGAADRILSGMQG